MQHTRILMHSELASPCGEGSVYCDFVVLHALGRRDDTSVPAVSIAHHLRPTLCFAQNGFHRTVLVLPGTGVVSFQKLIQALQLSRRLRKVKLKSAAQISVFHQPNYLRQCLNELVLNTSKLLELNHVHSPEIIDLHLSSAGTPGFLKPDL